MGGSTLYNQKVITEREMSFFNYMFIRIYKNKNVQGYLTFLKEFYKTVGSETEPFYSFVTYCKKALKE